MKWRIVVQNKDGFVDHRGESLRAEWESAGLRGKPTIRAGQAYELSGALTETDARRLADKLLADPVTQAASVSPADAPAAGHGRRAEIWPKKGVADPVADTVVLAAQDLGVAELSARSGHAYDFSGKVSPADVKRFCEERLMNTLIQSVEVV